MKVAQDKIDLLRRSFRRIFALPISRLTIRETQNAIGQTLPTQSEEIKKNLYESLLTGQLNGDLKKEKNSTDLADLIDEFAFHFKMAREVADMGEYMNSFSCDFAQQGKQIYFINRMRRIDGEEYHFLSAPETNVRLAHMFINRLSDLKKAVGNVPFEPRFKEELTSLKKAIDTLLN